MITSVSMKMREEELEKIERIREPLSKLIPTGITRHGLLKLAIHRGLDAISGEYFGKMDLSGEATDSV